MRTRYFDLHCESNKCVLVVRSKAHPLVQAWRANAAERKTASIICKEVKVGGLAPKIVLESEMPQWKKKSSKGHSCWVWYIDVTIAR